MPGRLAIAGKALSKPETAGLGHPGGFNLFKDRGAVRDILLWTFADLLLYGAAVFSRERFK